MENIEKGGGGGFHIFQLSRTPALRAESPSDVNAMIEKASSSFSVSETPCSRGGILTI